MCHTLFLMLHPLENSMANLQAVYLLKTNDITTTPPLMQLSSEASWINYWFWKTKKKILQSRRRILGIWKAGTSWSEMTINSARHQYRKCNQYQQDEFRRNDWHQTKTQMKECGFAGKIWKRRLYFHVINLHSIQWCSVLQYFFQVNLRLIDLVQFSKSTNIVFI